MTNTPIFKNLIDRYNAISFTHNYIFGFEDRGSVYMVTADANVLPYVCCLDSASRGAGKALRFKPNKAQKELLKTLDCEILCSAEYLNHMVSKSKYNFGEIFEKLVTEKFGQTWTKDKVPFTEDGDLTVNGTPYQIKYAKATFCNEKSIANLEKKG